MSVNDGSKVGMMDPAYFVGKKILLQWMNSLLKVNLKKIEETCTGAIACQILQSIFPGKVPMSKVDFGAKYDYEYIKNYKVLQKTFDKLKVSKVVPVDKLVRGKYQDNLEFMQWMKSFYDLNGGAADDYDPIAARSRSKGGAKITSTEGGSAPAPSSKRASKPPSARSRPAIKETTKENARKTAGGAPSLPAAKLREANQELTAQVSQLKIEIQDLRAANAEKDAASNDTEVKMALDGLEKERDFYFKKLRDIEVYLQDQGEPDQMEDGPTKELVQKIFGVLYATDDDEDFEAPAASPEKSMIAQSPSKLPGASALETVA